MTAKDIWMKIKLIFVPSESNNYRPKFLESRVLLWCMVALFVLKLVIVPFLIYFPKTLSFSAVIKTTLIELLNQERKSSGLQPLKENAELNRAASLKAQDILEKDYFSHQSPTGVSPWYWFKIVGYNYKIAGENLAIGFLDSEEVNQAWLDSPSHRANLLNPNYKDVGVAIAKGNFQNSQTTVVVQLFGDPKKTVSIPKVQTKEEIREEVAGAGEEDKSSSSPFTVAAWVKEVKPVIEKAQGKATFSFLSFLSTDYYKILQIIIYGFLGFIILALLINIFVRIDIQHTDLILKTLGFIAVLVIFILMDKGVITGLIPHNFNIY